MIVGKDREDIVSSTQGGLPCCGVSDIANPPGDMRNIFEIVRAIGDSSYECIVVYFVSLFCCLGILCAADLIFNIDINVIAYSCLCP